MADELQRLRNLLAQHPPPERPSLADLKPKQTPTCREAGVAEGILFTATVISGDTYLVEKRPVNIGDITRVFGKQLAVASEKHCKQSVRVLYAGTISTAAYDHALRQIEEIFYVSRGGKDTSVATN